MRGLWWMAWMVGVGCTATDGTLDTGGLGDGSAASDASDANSGSDGTVNATILLLNAMSGAGMAGIDVESPAGDSAQSGADGSASFPIDSGGTFEFRVRGNGVLDHLVFGPTGSDDFVYPTFVATETLLNSVNSSLGTMTAPERGIVVVGIDYEDLSPAVGATASIGAMHDSPWVIGGMGAAFGNTVPSGGMGVVIFPNVPPGETSVTVQPPSGTTCSAFPGGGQMPNGPVFMNHVTVVTFHCR
ncbi:MAG: hypothetical protein VX127_06615 [Myxococcota bacterium]|nr:hypothetical protein [Myxococcota bacterium]